VLLLVNNLFAERLLVALTAREMSQSRLAEAMGISRSTITGWLKYHKLPDAFLLAKICTALGCSADWLLGLETQLEKQDASGHVRWIEQLPPHLQGTQREQIAYGVHLFNRLLLDGGSLADVDAYGSWESIRAALLAALRAGAVRLTHVARDADLEAQIKARYPALKEVIVAAAPMLDDTVIRTEFVAFLAATELLNHIIRPGVVGLGSGYTLLRLCENSIPGIDQFSGTRWVPLLAFPPENMTDYSANTLARLMSIRHPGSQAVVLPHPVEATTRRIKNLQEEALRLMKNMSTVFVSVSGVDRRSPSGSTHLLAEFRSADYALEAPDLRSAYGALDDKSRFGAELLRYLLDREGNIISRDSGVGAQVDLDILRYNCAMIGRVCMVAAGAYKALGVLTCIQNRLVNSLVIDSEIASYLMERG
jgi:DNA-binding transcriptional regulator LsrR (DeoR family)